jgi:UDP-glucuronate 4-epimerase
VCSSDLDSISRPLSLYAATKGSSELLGHTYSALFGIPMTFFRFFTVYGPWGRPDMAAFKFVRAILADEPIDIYNHGNLARDFTYIDDLVEAIIRLTENSPQANNPSGKPQGSNDFDAPFRVVNVGKGAPDKLMDFIGELEQELGKSAEKNFMPMQDGEMLTTFADTALLKSLTGYRPETPLSVGIPKFVSWYRQYYNV